MRFGKVRTLVGAFALVLSAGLASAANNPAYDSWAKLKPGSSVTLKTSTEAAGQKSEQQTTYILDEVTADKAVIEIKMSMVVAGNKMDMPARKQDVPKSFGAATPTTPVAPSAPATPTPKVTEESLTIDGKAYKCQVMEASNEANGMKTTSKTWTSVDVPNNLVKMEATTTGTVASKTTMEVTKVELK